MSTWFDRLAIRLSRSISRRSLLAKSGTGLLAGLLAATGARSGGNGVSASASQLLSNVEPEINGTKPPINGQPPVNGRISIAPIILVPVQEQIREIKHERREFRFNGIVGRSPRRNQRSR